MATELCYCPFERVTKHFNLDAYLCIDFDLMPHCFHANLVIELLAVQTASLLVVEGTNYNIKLVTLNYTLNNSLINSFVE